MRRVFAIVVALALFGAGPAFANFNQSKAWFESLAPDIRSDTQANLTLLGFYEYLVDGSFAKGTYDALTSFQRSLDRPATGVLSPTDRELLLEQAAAVYNELGMDLIEDQEGQVAVILPAGLLSQVTPGPDGNLYAATDGSISLETIRRPVTEQTFTEVYDSLRASGEGRSVTYANINADRFVVTGQENGKRFYAMFRNAGTESVGYLMTWSPENDARGRMLSIFIASHFAPLSLAQPDITEPDDRTRKLETVDVDQRFGVFYLPAANTDVIYLNGDIGTTLGPDFYRALSARPEVKVLVLNSPGGYVDAALSVAHEVHRLGIDTLVGEGMGCYSACSYIFFAGQPRYTIGELGVHQISAEVADLVLAQTTLSDVLDALDQFGVNRVVITQMLRTPPEQMYVFSTQEIAELAINVGGPVEVASIDFSALDPDKSVDTTFDTTVTAGQGYVHLGSQESREAAERSLQYATNQWAGVLAGAVPEIAEVMTERGTVFRIVVAALSVENANAICSAIKSAGGGCYVANAP